QLQLIFLSGLRPPPLSTLFPYTTLFRSRLFGSQVVRQPAQELHVFVELLRVEVPDDEAQLGLRRRAGDLDRVNESFASFGRFRRSEEHTSELQSRGHLVCRLLLEKKNIH